VRLKNSVIDTVYRHGAPHNSAIAQLQSSGAPPSEFLSPDCRATVLISRAPLRRLAHMKVGGSSSTTYQ